MNILLVSATAYESSGVTSRLEPSPPGHRFGNMSVDVLVTGIGMVQTAYAMGEAFARKKYDVALNMGLAGAYDRKLALCDVVNVTSDRFPELGAEDGDGILPIDRLGVELSEGDRAVAGPITGVKLYACPAINSLAGVAGITANTVHGRKESIAVIRKRYAPGVETMEGAAFFYACARSGTPCAQIRAVSNYVEPRDKTKWKAKEAVERLSEVVLRTLEELNRLLGK